MIFISTGKNQYIIKYDQNHSLTIFILRNLNNLNLLIMNELGLVRDIMSTDIITIKPQDRLVDIKELFKINSIRHLLVVDNNEIVGILSKNDLLKVNTKDNWKEHIGVDIAMVYTFTAEEVMTKNILIINSETTIKEAAKILSEKDFHALPVVDNGILKGILTTTDLVKFVLTLEKDIVLWNYFEMKRYINL